MRRFFRFWLVLAVAYPAITLSICWIVSGSIVYPREMIAHIFIVPLVQATLLALIFRGRPENP